MEIILNLLLFSVLLVVGLQFFIHAHTRTEETTQLHQAVSIWTTFLRPIVTV